MVLHVRPSLPSTRKFSLPRPGCYDAKLARGENGLRGHLGRGHLCVMSPVLMKFEATPHKKTAFLSALHVRSRTQRALDIALLLETHVPWDLTLSSALLRDEAQLIAEELIALCERCGGEENLVRGAQLFARCDHDHAGGLTGPELLTAAAVVSEEIFSREGAPPDDVDLARLDEATAFALVHLREECLEHLHEISLLQLLAPPPYQVRGVRAIAASAVAGARGGDEARREVAAQAIDDAVAAERSRVKSAIGVTRPVRLLPFLHCFASLTEHLGARRQAVSDCARAHAQRSADEQARLDERQQRDYARRTSMRAAAIAAGEERRRREIDAGKSELQRILQRAGMSDIDGVSIDEGRGGGASSMGGRHPGHTDAAEPRSQAPTPDTRPPMHDSGWTPGVTFTFFEARKEKRRLGVDKFFSAMDPAPERVVRSGDEAWLIPVPYSGLGMID